MFYLAICISLVFYGYIIASVLKGKELPVTLSDTYYLWPKWVFPAVMILTASTLLPCWLTITDGHPLQFLVFLACAGLVFVGTAPNFKNDKLEYSIHVKAAYIAAFAAIGALVFITYKWWYLFYIIALVFILFFRKIKTHYMFLLEWSIINAALATVVFNLK